MTKIALVVVLSQCLLGFAPLVVATAEEGPPQETFVPPEPYYKNYRDNGEEAANARKLAGSPCFANWELWHNRGCNYDAALAIMQQHMQNWGCGHFGSAAAELRRIFGVGTDQEARDGVAAACRTAFDEAEATKYATFSDISERNPVWDKAFFDGGGEWNEARETNTGSGGMTQMQQWAYPNSRIGAAYYGRARYNTGIRFPSEMSNFANCDLRAVMCCWVQDRQAGDNNGNCDKPYDENCLDADPMDNTDVCYVDMARSPESNRVGGGYAVYPGNEENDAHCHGFAWGTDPNETNAQFKGVNLFYVSMYDHLAQRGYVRNVPGAPMCACVEQMPVVSRSDCTQINFIEGWVGFGYDSATGFFAEIGWHQVDFQACQGANGNNNDLSAYYEQLVLNGEAPGSDKNMLDQYLVGDNQCGRAINAFLGTRRH